MKRALYILPVLLAGLLLWAGKQNPPTFGPTGAAPTVGASCPTGQGATLDTSGRMWTCDAMLSPAVWMPIGPLIGTSGSIGGNALLAGACSTGTMTVTGAQVGWPVEISASDGTNIPALGVALSGAVTSANTVTVNVCALLALTPTTKTYNVAVLHP